MEKLKQYKYIILIVLAILGFIFYWYEYRPSMIKKECFEEARETIARDYGLEIGRVGHPDTLKFYEDLYDTYYEQCLQERGL